GVAARSRRCREASLFERPGWSLALKVGSEATTPAPPLRWLRIFFLLAQPPLLTRRGIRSPSRRSQELNNYQFFTHEDPNTNQDIGLDGPSIALRNHFNAAFASAFRR